MGLATALTGCDRLFGSPGKRIQALETELQELQRQVNIDKASVGRYQVVNPTPAVASRTMLLDSVTGRTWMICTVLGEDKKPIAGTEGSGWCDMTQADERGER